MANPVAMAQMIRLAFQTLSADNAHHSFEHLCRHVAKRRIVSNVLPATGPVSAGGDQGRDFETFRSYLATELPFALGFLALASADVIVLACTVQKDGLRTKFERDVTSICTQGTHVDRIYIFATENVPTRLRHDLQTWARQQYDVALEIIDGTALAEWLAEPELYWIAQEYLSLPAELAPQVDRPDSETQLPSWYAELREYWQQPDRKPISLGDLFDLRHGLQHAIPQGPARADLPGWLSLMTQLAEGSPDAEARLHAVYEVVAARSRGAADVRPAEPLIRRFIDEVQDKDDPTLLFNASVLVQFCIAAAGLGHTDIPIVEIVGWVPPLRRHVEQLLNRDWGPNTRTGLLQVAAHLALQFDYTGVEVRGNATLDDIDRNEEELIDAIERGTLQTYLGSGTVPVIDLDAGMGHLLALVELLPEAPVYPIGTFGTFVDLLAPILRDHPLYRPVCRGLDNAVAAQEGEAAVGDRCRQRAVALREAGRLLDALREFHQAKINWFHGDTLYAALRAMANIVDIYSALGMYLAAKKYALAMAALARASTDPIDRELVPIALFSAANMDHLAGAWITSAKLAMIAGQAHIVWAPDAGSLERHAYVTEAMKYQTFTVVVAQQTRPEFVPIVHDILRGGLFDGLTVARDASAAPRTDQEWAEWLSDKAGAPFSDVGPRRTIAFHALGLLWTVHGRNEQNTVLAVEDFTSALQILLVEFASLDLVLIAQDVDIEIRTFPPGRRPIDTYLTRIEDGRRLWLLFLPTELPADATAEDRVRDGVLHLAFQVLIGNSLLDRQRFSELMDQAASNGLFSNLEIGRPYRELALFRTEPVQPLADPRHHALTHAAHPNPRTGAPQLQPTMGTGPGYSTDKVNAILAERYQVLPVSICHTIPNLLADPHVRDLFLELRGEGWKDWHLLNVLANLTINHRLTVQHGTITAERASQMARAFRDEALRGEQPDDPRISPEQVSREAMEEGIQLVAMSSLHRWELTVHHPAADAATVVRLLAERYGFWTDDIPHPDPFQGLLTDRP